MAVKPKKPFLLRISPKVLGAIERLAGDELRSTNSQIEILLMEALKKRGIVLQNTESPSETTIDNVKT